MHSLYEMESDWWGGLGGRCVRSEKDEGSEMVVNLSNSSDGCAEKASSEYNRLRNTSCYIRKS